MSIQANRLQALILAAGLVAAAAGCADPLATPAEYRTELSGLRYPADAKRAEPVDVRVVQDGGRLELANRTARRFENMQLWLNREHVQRVEAVSIGTGNRLSLDRFVNRHGERFPTPGLLRPQKGEEVTLAELYDPEADVRYPLIVQPEPDPTGFSHENVTSQESP